MMNQQSSAFRRQLLVDFSEADLSRLRQQYRRAQAERRAYKVKTQALLCRDRREIQRLQDEREGLLRNLRISQSCFNSWRDASVVQDLTGMLACQDRLDEELNAEKGKVASLKDQIFKLERKLVEQKSRGRPTCSMKSENSNLLKNTRLVENKLSRGRKCFNKLMIRNAELREELAILQLERKQFLHVHSQLEKELHAIRKDISKLMTKCAEVFNDSVKIQEKQRMLRDQDAKDVARCITGKSILERKISLYCHLDAFLDTKAVPRKNLYIDHSKVKSQQLKSKKLGPEDFEDTIKQILRQTEESDLDKLIRNFIQTEEHNFTLLISVNRQHHEAEALRRQISKLCSEREIFAAEEQQRQEQHRTLQRRVAIKQEAAEQRLAVCQQRVEFTEKLLDRLKEGLESLLQIGYGSPVICDRFDSSDKVWDERIKEYLRMLEDRVNELLTLQSYPHFQQLSQWDIDGLSTIAGQLLGITPRPVSRATAAETPAPDNDPDLIESELLEATELLNREDLLTLVNKRIERKKKTD